jgi:hypothetical protein
MSKKLTTIDPSDLDAVSGGRRIASSGSRGAFEQQMLDAFRDLQSEMRDLVRDRDSGSSNQMTQLLMMQSLMGGNNNNNCNCPAPQQSVYISGKKRWC